MRRYVKSPMSISGLRDDCYQIIVSRCLQAYSNTATVGNALAVLGGFALWIGGGIISVNGIQALYGAGMQIFVGKRSCAMIVTGSERCLH